MSKKWTVVFGGAGFLGSNLCKSLLSSEKKVICIDNLYTGNLKNIEPFQDNANFLYFNHDIIEKWTTDLELESIYNLACPASPFHYQKNPIYTLKINFNGALNVLELAEDHNVPVFQASTSEIYGDPLEHPQVEKYWGNVNSIGIRSCYDEGKRVAETLFFDFHREKKIDIKVARIFNTYGPKMHPNDGRVVSNFIIQALKNEPITVYGDGSQTRSFCYVDDEIDGLYKLLLSDYSRPINIGNPNEITILEFAKEIIKLTNTKQNIIYKPLPTDDPLQRQPDITKAKEILNWEPKISRSEGMKRTFKYFSNLTSEELFRSEHKDFSNHIRN